MIVQQLSVFLENKSGRLTEILDFLGMENIRIIAASVADTSEYGIMRLITTDNERAFSLLKANRVSVNLSDVFVLSNSGRVGDFSRQLKYFALAGISIEYMYCFSVQKKAFLIIHTNNREASRQVINFNKLTVISEAELKEL